MDSTPLLKLSYIGKRAMGALEFVPDYTEENDKESLNISSLADLAAEVYKDRSKAVLSRIESITMKKLLYLGTSADGKRPKAVVAYNPKTGEFRSGQVDLPEDFVENPKEKIETVINAVAKFGQWCDHYNVDAGTKKLIQNALDFIRPR